VDTNRQPRRWLLGKSMAVTTAESFLEALEASQLLDAEQLATAREAASETADPKSLARLLVQKELLSRWQAEKVLGGRRAFFLGKYKLIRLLGHGGMGRVFLGQHTTMNRHVALKIVSKEVGRDRDSLERFYGEARAIAQLDHPNIVQAYNVDNEGDRHYIVMEYVDGRDLDEMVEADGPLGFQRAVDFMRQAAEGLAHAHGRNMIHCDIKPSNLLVNREGTLKILDMGLARLSIGGNGSGVGEQEQAVLGTVDYQAPEQAMRSDDFDHRADIYSLGCTFYFLLTGRPPFPEGTLPERILKHQTQQPQSIAELRAGTPPDLIAICSKMMAKDPAERYQSASEIVQVMAAWHPPQEPLIRAMPLEEAVPVVDALDVQSTMVRAANGSQSDGSGEASGLKRLVGKKLFLALGGLAVAGLLIGGIVWWASSGGSSSSGAKKSGEGKTTSSKSADREKSKPSRDKKDDDWGIKPPPELIGPKPPEEKPSQPKPPQETPTSPSPVDPPEQPSQPPEEKPPEEKPPEPIPPEEMPPEPKPPEEKPPEEKPPEVKPPEDPFVHLGTRLPLPPPEEDASPATSAWTELGRLGGRLDAPVALRLVGGQDVLRSKRQFVLTEETSGEELSWRVEIDPPPPSGAAEIGRFAVEDRTLRFQWLSDSRDAAQLRYCLLSLAVDGKRRLLPLIEPAQGEALVVDLDRPSVSTKIPLDSVPDMNKLHMEIVKLDGKFPPNEIKDGARDGTDVVLQRKDHNGNMVSLLTLRLTFAARGSAIEVEMRRVLPEGLPPRFKWTDIPIRMNQIDMQRQARLGEAKRIRDQKQRDQQTREIENFFKPGLDNLKWMEERYNELNKLARIRLRFYLDVKDADTGTVHQVEVIRADLEPGLDE